MHRPPEPSILPFDGSPLYDLPPIILIEILQYLDSASLRCLSSTCKHMRLMCFKVASDSAMVHIKWERAESGHWSEKCFVSYFKFKLQLLFQRTHFSVANLILPSKYNFM